jgi:outer membrane protein TolC
MSSRHEPREAFVSQLEDRLRAELDRPRLAPPAPGWMPRSRLGLALATAAVVIVSMAMGGGVVAAAYEAQQNELRDMLVGTFEQQAAIAAQRLDMARRQLRVAEDRLAVGLEGQAAVGDARLKVSEAEAALRVIELDLAEVRATGREPMKTVSAPLVSGRDFVLERWQVEMSVPAAALELAKRNVQAAQRRFEVGLANAVDVEAAGARQIDLESAIQLAQRKIGIRQAFLRGGMSAAVADLRVLEVETEQQRTALARRIDFARRQMDDLRIRAKIGTASPLEVAEAEVRLQELQLALTKADYELALIRRQLGK